MTDLYLILHKVRGEPAFDIAEQMEMGEETWWIIPTSGHRAYPSGHWPLSDMTDVGFIMSDSPELDDDLPDHYSYRPEPSIKPTARHRAILERLGIAKPIALLRKL